MTNHTQETPKAHKEEPKHKDQHEKKKTPTMDEVVEKLDHHGIHMDEPVETEQTQENK